MSTRSNRRRPVRVRAVAEDVAVLDQPTTAAVDPPPAPGHQVVEAGGATAITPAGQGRLMLRLIKAGWSLNGNFYPAEVLRRDGPAAWPAGTHNFIDHPTDTEDMERPAGSLRTLASYLTEAASWDEASQSLVAPVRVFGQWREAVTDWAESGVIGMSIRAWVDGELGSRDGRHGFIVSQIVEGRSVDYVTTPAAGGRILEVLEAAHPGRARAVVEARNMATWLESRIHLTLTELADGLYGDGRLTRPERISLSAATGDALDAWTTRVTNDAPALYQRDLFDEPQPGATQPAAEAPTDDTRQLLRAAVLDRHAADKTWLWVRDFDPDQQVVWFERNTEDGQSATLQQAYSPGDDGALTLTGDPVEVVARTVYQPAGQPTAAAGGGGTEPAQQTPAGETAGDPPGVAPEPTQPEEKLVTTPTQEATAVREAEEARRLSETLRADVEAATRDRDTAQQETLAARAEADTARRELARYRAVDAARPIAAEAITNAGLPKATQTALLDAALTDVPLTEGLAFDEARFRLALSNAVAAKKHEYDAWEAERAAAAEAAGAGQVTGLGSTATSTVDVGAVHEGLMQKYKARGMTDEAARLAAFGRPA